MKSDTLVTEETRTALCTAAAKLEDIQDTDKDWHPRSDGLVLDLVHPSLYPLLYGRTHVLPHGKLSMDDCTLWAGKGIIMPIPSPPELEGNWRSANNRKSIQVNSARFQWLPSQVDLHADGSVRFASYINNLHPQEHATLYGCIERIVAAAIPMWNSVMTSVLKAKTHERAFGEQDCTHGWRKPRVYDGDVPEFRRDPDEPDTDCEEGEEDKDEDKNFDLLAEVDCPLRQERIRRRIVYPEPSNASYQACADQNYYVVIPMDPRYDFAAKGLQVIFKLANVHLTPEES